MIVGAFRCTLHGKYKLFWFLVFFRVEKSVFAFYSPFSWYIFAVKGSLKYRAVYNQCVDFFDGSILLAQQQHANRMRLDFWRVDSSLPIAINILSQLQHIYQATIKRKFKSVKLSHFNLKKSWCCCWPQLWCFVVLWFECTCSWCTAHAQVERQYTPNSNTSSVSCLVLSLSFAHSPFCAQFPFVNMCGCLYFVPIDWNAC